MIGSVSSLNGCLFDSSLVLVLDLFQNFHSGMVMILGSKADFSLIYIVLIYEAR
jgi:hypothetical protein